MKLSEILVQSGAISNHPDCIVKEIQELERDAALGKLVRQLPYNAKLSHNPIHQDALSAGFKWILESVEGNCIEGDTPENVIAFALMPEGGEPK